MFRAVWTVVVVSAFGPLPAARADEAEEKAVALLERQGAKYTRDERLPGRPIVAINYASCSATEEHLKILAALPHLRELDLRRAHNFYREMLPLLAEFKSLTTLGLTLNDAWLEHVAKLRHVTTFDFEVIEATDAGMKMLVPMPGVRTLDLSRTRVTDAGLKELGGLNKLTTFHLPLETVTDEGLKELARLTAITTLHLPHRATTARALRHLAPLTNLTELRTYGTLSDVEAKELVVFKKLAILTAKLTDAGMRELAAVKSLTHLHSGDAYTDEWLKAASALDNLTYLSARFSGSVSGIGFRHLAGLKNLRTLNIPHSHMSEEMAQGLATVQQLTSLDLGASSIPNEGLKEVAKLQNLEVLGLGATRVSGDAIKELAALKNLVHLDLRAVPVTEGAFKAFTTLDKLSNLQADSGHITDEVLIAFIRSGRLHALWEAGHRRRVPTTRDITTLDLTATNVTGIGVRELTALPNLKSLALPSRAGRDGLKHVAALKGLESLTVYRIPVEELKSLAGLKLTQLNLPIDAWNNDVTDRTVQILREIGLLHALECARTDDEHRRPTKPEEVTFLYLGSLKLTSAGLKEFVGFTNVTRIHWYSTGTAPDVEAEVLAVFTKLERLYLDDKCPVGDLGAKHLAKLTNLTSLWVSCPQLTDTGLKELVKLTNLTDLSLDRAAATETGFAVLAGLKKLKSLSLSGNKNFTDAALAHVSGLTELERLHIMSSGVTDVGMKHLAPLKNLTYLGLPFAKVTDAGVKELVALENLNHLSLSYSAVGDGALRDIAAFKKLTQLDLASTAVSNAGIPKIVAMKNLRYVDLRNTKVTADGVKALNNQHPECHVLATVGR